MASTTPVPASTTADSDRRISAWVRMLMTHRSRTHGDVAEALHMSKPSFSERLNGKTAWKAYEVDLLAEVFGIEDRGLFYRDPEDAVRNR